MKDMISVIVPVYKVEDYLERCITSIVNQTYKNLEIILIDDGSPDHCGEICDEWSRKDDRIKVIHKENGGLSDARNAGMKIATGEYIAFVDSDDWIDEKLLEVLLDALIDNYAQISACGIVKAYDDYFEDDKRNYSQKIYTSQEALNTLIHGNGFYAVAWNKLYKAELLQNIQFPVGKLHEDEFFTYKVIARASRLVLCTEVKYYYRQRTGSIMSGWSEKRLDALQAYKERNMFIKNNYPSLYVEDKVIFFLACVSFYHDIEKMDGNIMRVKKTIQSLQKEIHFTISELCKSGVASVLRIIKGKLYFIYKK